MFTEKEELCLSAPAKINLFLEILGQRENGYHDLRSILAPVAIEDRVRLRKTDGFLETVLDEANSVNCELLTGAHLRQNLATRAAIRLKEATGHRGGARIVLQKHIPIGGGLGGGSADAAAVLRGCNALWQTGLTTEELAAIGAEVGCDVPALVHDGLVMMEGLGEKVTPLDHGVGSWWVVLVNPGFAISTADIYSRCSQPLTSDHLSAKRMVCSLRDGDIRRVAESLFNGLQETVLRKYPLLEILACELDAAGALGTLLSGSGATLFALAENEAHARRIADHMERRSTGTAWCRTATLLPDGVTVAHGPLEA